MAFVGVDCTGIGDEAFVLASPDCAWRITEFIGACPTLTGALGCAP